jgi:FAD/FMN-containing dehydrogenase
MSASKSESEIVYTTLDHEDASFASDLLTPLRSDMRGPIWTQRDTGYDDARKLWNAMLDPHPAVIARCLSTQDVRRAIAFAREHDMLLCVRGGGHHIAGNAMFDGSFAIDLSLMRGVRVDPELERARVGGGALLGDVDQETQSFGLATPLGINSTTGFGGLCLGGGFGWLTRKYGLTIDNLVSADVVTADGQVHVVSAVKEPDLFWAIRGGGGNFGVVTSFELKLHPVGPLLHSGFVVYEGARAREVLRSWRDFTESAPDELAVWAVLRKAPPLPFLAPEVHGTDVVVFAVVYAGDPDEGPRFTAPIEKFGEPIASVLGRNPYAAFQQALDPLLGPGARNYWKSAEFAELEDNALEVVMDAARAVPGPEAEVIIAQLGGAMGRVARNATAYAGRDSKYVMNVHGRWRDKNDDEKFRAWARSTYDRISPLATDAGYINFLTADEEARLPAAYGPNYERLRELKRRYDPDNVFRMNHNVPPLESSDRRAARPPAARSPATR